MMAKIYTKVEGYTGIRAGVPFVNGVGETADPYLLGWFRAHGYTVEEAPAPTPLQCPHCGKEYKTEKSLAAHVKKEHPQGDNASEE